MTRRPGPTVRTRVVEHLLDDSGDEVTRRHEDRLVGEEPLELRLTWPGAAPRRAWVTMRTPGHDFELAAGFVLHESLATAADVRRIAYCTDADLAPEEQFNVVTVTFGRTVELPHRHQATSAGSSACGVCGKDSVREVLDVRRARQWEGALPQPDVVRRLPALLRERQSVFARTGGVHAAGLATDRKSVV